MAVDSNLGTLVGSKEGAVVSNPGNEGRIAQAWVNVQGGYAGLFRVFLALRRMDSEKRGLA